MKQKTMDVTCPNEECKHTFDVLLNGTVESSGDVDNGWTSCIQTTITKCTECKSDVKITHEFYEYDQTGDINTISINVALA
jgi:hypothetical protein|nr:MAG TPA: hypothetical protein [Caudoviricetes sp.]